MKKILARLSFPALMGATALALAGCTTVRTASFNGYDRETVFNASVAAACSQKGLIVYQADKANGVINTQTAGVFGGTEITMTVSGDSLNIVAPGAVNPWPDRIISAAKNKISADGVRSPKADKPSGVSPSQDLDLERQKLELEKERLKLDRDKLEFEKQKLQQGQ
ncbi:MAG: hypothetical protein AAB091_02100 [Elusimicrobiota bacterium]